MSNVTDEISVDYDTESDIAADLRQVISNAELVLQEQRATATPELSFADHRLSVGEYIRLIHEVRRQQYHLSVSSRLQ